jgi:hypothetical protein
LSIEPFEHTSTDTSPQFEEKISKSSQNITKFHVLLLKYHKRNLHSVKSREYPSCSTKPFTNYFRKITLVKLLQTSFLTIVGGDRLRSPLLSLHCCGGGHVLQVRPMQGKSSILLMIKYFTGCMSIAIGFYIFFAG